MKLSYFPQVKVYHTSKTFHGQVYIPLANWLMMIGSIIVTAVYNNVCTEMRKFDIQFADFVTDDCPR